MTTFFPAAAAAILLASSGVRSENTFSRSTPGIGSTRGLKWWNNDNIELHEHW